MPADSGLTAVSISIHICVVTVAAQEKFSWASCTIWVNFIMINPFLLQNKVSKVNGQGAIRGCKLPKIHFCRINTGLSTVSIKGTRPQRFCYPIYLRDPATFAASRTWPACPRSRSTRTWHSTRSCPSEISGRSWDRKDRIRFMWPFTCSQDASNFCLVPGTATGVIVAPTSLSRPRAGTGH